MARWKYLLIVIALGSVIVDQYFRFVSDVASRFSDLALVCLLSLIVIALVALVRRRWRDLATISLGVLAVLLVNRMTENLAEIGFRVHAGPLQEHLSTCRLIEFVDDDGAKQQVGRCKGFRFTSLSMLTVIYDTTGQFELPSDRRTAAWKSAVAKLPAGSYLRKNEGASRISGDFFSIVIPETAEDGS
jgi:hypothetical protein